MLVRIPATFSGFPVRGTVLVLVLVLGLEEEAGCYDSLHVSTGIRPIDFTRVRYSSNQLKVQCIPAPRDNIPAACQQTQSWYSSPECLHKNCRSFRHGTGMFLLFIKMRCPKRFLEFRGGGEEKTLSHAFF